jgi:hypothetical protein
MQKNYAQVVGETGYTLKGKSRETKVLPLACYLCKSSFSGTHLVLQDKFLYDLYTYMFQMPNS